MENQSYVPQIQGQPEQNDEGRRRGMELAAAGQNHQQPQPRACPRCNSGNTKFCYFNNYSFSQPRYFCKGCRRYWTHGGTLRNVPVGGSSRKAKRPRSSSSTAAGPLRQPAPASGGATSVLAPSMMSPNQFPVGGGGGGFYSSLAAGQSMTLQPPAVPNMGLLQGMPGWQQSFIGSGGDRNAPPDTVAGTGAQFWTIGGAVGGEQSGGGEGSVSNPDHEWPDFPAAAGCGGSGSDK